jgi:hypothetical protein
MGSKPHFQIGGPEFKLPGAEMHGREGSKTGKPFDHLSMKGDGQCVVRALGAPGRPRSFAIFTGIGICAYIRSW